MDQKTDLKLTLIWQYGYITNKNFALHLAKVESFFWEKGIKNVSHGKSLLRLPPMEKSVHRS